MSTWDSIILSRSRAATALWDRDDVVEFNRTFPNLHAGVDGPFMKKWRVTVFDAGKLDKGYDYVDSLRWSQMYVCRASDYKRALALEHLSNALNRAKSKIERTILILRIRLFA